MADLLVIVPSRGRPGSVARVVEAWTRTGAYDDGAELVFLVDADDPQHSAYWEQELPESATTLVRFVTVDRWKPMVHKLNEAALLAATGQPPWFAVGFAGDDHLPRSVGWAGRYLAELRRLGTGIVYGNDLIQSSALPTQWAMTADIVRTLGRMVPADVEHLYCDNAIADLGRGAGCLAYLDDVVVQHCHPVAGRADWDDQYRRVNSADQYAKDGAAYRAWRDGQLLADVAAVRALREVTADA